MRLRVVEAKEPGEIREILAERAAVRLGRDVFLSGRLAPGAIADAVESIRLFREAMKTHGVDAYRAVATSAVRDASNGDVLIERVEREAGIHLEIIEGVEEARLVRAAVLHAVKLGSRRALLIDIGGGSVELTLQHGSRTTASLSLPMGTVRLAEAFLSPDAPVTPARRTLLLEYVSRLLGEAKFLADAKAVIAIATGGNAEAIATLAPGRSADGDGIDVAAMVALNQRMSALTVRERRDQFNLRGDRADVIVPAMFVLGAVAEAIGATNMVVPGVGLKDGILFELIDRAFRVFDEHGEAAAVEADAVVLGRKYHFDERHALHVASIASTIYDELAPMHGLGDAERSWLRLAAILHDVGDFVGYESHHKHTYYIVENSDLMGLPVEAKAAVANVARYHRKAFPDLSHPGFRKLDRRARAAVRKLSAILRIADALDREHLAKVTNVKIEIARGRVNLHATGEGDLSLSLWTASRKADLFEEVFETELRVAGAEDVPKGISSGPRRP